MGLFDETVHSVASTKVKLITDTPNVGKDSVLLSVLTDGDISADLINAYANGIGLKMRNMHAKASVDYFYGLPDGLQKDGRTWTHLVKAHIETEVGATVVMIGVTSGSVNTDALAHEYLTDNRAWDLVDNLVLIKPPGAGAGDVQFVSSRISTPGTLELTYTGAPVELVAVANLQPLSSYYHASYTIDEGITQFWNYDTATGTYPDLVRADVIEADNPYFPIIPFRVDNVNQATDGPAGYVQSAQNLMRSVGMDFEAVCATIHDSPDIGDVDHAFIYTAVPVASDEQNSINYLHTHFKHLEPLSAIKKSSLDAHQATEADSNAVQNTPPPFNTMRISDSTLVLDYHYAYIDTVIHTGTVGTIGVSNRTITVRDRIRNTYEYTSGSKDQTRTATRYSYDTSLLVFTNQINATQYEETTVYGLYVINHIYPGHTIESSLAEAVDILIPLNAKLVDAMSIKDGDLLFYDALHVVFNSYQATKLEWYETSVFAVIVQIIAIVITIYSLGTLAEVAVAAATIGQAAVNVITQILVQLAISAAVDFVVDKLGIEAAIVLAVVGTLVGQGVDSTFADNIMGLIDIMIAEVMEDLEESISSIQDEMNALVSTQSDLDKEFERLEAELRGDADINYLDVVRLRPNIDINETPSEFYHRAVHAGNIGIASLDMPRSFVEGKLELPVITQIT